MKPIVWKILLVIVAITLCGFACTPQLLPVLLARIEPEVVFSVSTTQRQLFLTIDDGPSENTTAILDVLRKHQVPAVFFIISSHVHSPDQLQRIVAEGHALGNHLRTTKACSKLSLGDFKHDLDEAAALIRGADNKTHLFRPPSDFGTTEQRAYARQMGWTPILGTVFPLDHWIENRRSLNFLLRWLATSGGIVILHDGPVRGANTARVLDEIIPQLKSAGYSFGRLQVALPIGTSGNAP